MKWRILVRGHNVVGEVSQPSLAVVLICVTAPFAEDEKPIFLKTIIPSRKATKQYLSEEPEDHEA